jgi:hypothetical protein
VWSRLSIAQTQLLLAMVVIGLAGCTVADLYSGRATVYNVESEQAHDQGVLLNIVRASLRRPRQFTIVQKITGQAQASGGLHLNVPFGPYVTGNPNTAMIEGSASGGPSFDVATLETSDFFKGILQPIPAQLIDLYFHGEFPRDVLLNLFFEKIVMRRYDRECGTTNHEPRCEITFQNYPGRDVQLELFQALAGYLINLGLSTEAIAAPKKAGASKVGGKDKDDKSDDGAPAPSPAPAFCFAPRIHRAASLVPSYLVCGTPESANMAVSSRLGRVSQVGGIIISQEFGNLLSEIVAHYGDDPAARGFHGIERFSGKQVALAIYTRSPETAIYYVGEVVRRQLYPDLDPPSQVQVKVGPPFNPFPLKPCSIDPVPGGGWFCENIFALDVNAGLGAKTAFSVSYEGVQYSVPTEAGAGSSYGTRAGASYTVLSILRQMVILNTNANSLPATTVLSIRSQ